MNIMIKGKIKLIFFDMEGVIFDAELSDEEGLPIVASIWPVLAKSLGKEAYEIEKEGQRMWLKGKFKNYFEWCDYCGDFHKKYGLTMDKFYEIINKIKYMKGVKETFKELKKKEYITCIITGGFKNLANRAIRDLGVDHTFAAVEYFFDDGKLKSWNSLPSDYEGKVDFMRLMMREYKIKPEECAFVGEGINDIPLAKEVGMSIAFNGRKELQEVAKHSVNQEEKDLRGILEFFD